MTASALDRLHAPPLLLTAVIRRPCRLLVSWAMAGGLVAGGFLVAAVTLTGDVSGALLPEVTLVLFVLGAGAGVVHGGLLGYLARDRSTPAATARRELLRGLAWAFPGLLVSAMLTLWISLSGAVLGAEHPGVVETAGIFGAWMVGGLLCAWAFGEGVAALRRVYARWPGLRTASLLVSAVFAVLLTAFLASPPEIWFTQLRVNNAGAVVLAFAASVWIALPVVVAALAYFHRLGEDRSA